MEPASVYRQGRGPFSGKKRKGAAKGGVWLAQWSMRRGGQMGAEVQRSDDDDPSPGLWGAVVRGVKDFRGHLVPTDCKVGDPRLRDAPRRLHVLDHDHTGAPPVHGGEDVGPPIVGQIARA